MSYIRAGYPYTYVIGKSDSYVFGSCSEKNNKKYGYIEDYGHVSKEALMEMLSGLLLEKRFKWEGDDNTYYKYLIEKFSEKLGVKMRKKPLTEKQLDKLMEEIMRKK